MSSAISPRASSARREEELSLEEYLAECKRNPLAYATAAERMLKAIGEPQMVDTRNDPRLSRIFANKVIKIYPAFAEFYGMEDAIEQVVSLLPPRRAGPGGEEADPLPARPGRRRQELDRRAAEAADGARAVLRDQGLAGERVAARPVRRRRGRPDPREGIRHPAPLPEPHPVARGPSSGSRSTAATSASSRSSSATRRVLKQIGVAKTEPGDENNQDISLAGRQGRHPQARDLRAGRPGRLQLLRRPVPGQPGPARVRRDVQGADQGAAPAADGHPGRQLQGHRRLRRDPVRRHRPRAQQRERVEDLPQQQEQRGLPRPHLHRQGAVLPARLAKRSRSTRSCCATRRWPRPPARRAR